MIYMYVHRLIRDWAMKHALIQDRVDQRTPTSQDQLQIIRAISSQYPNASTRENIGLRFIVGKSESGRGSQPPSSEACIDIY